MAYIIDVSLEEVNAKTAQEPSRHKSIHYHDPDSSHEEQKLSRTPAGYFDMPKRLDEAMDRIKEIDRMNDSISDAESQKFAGENFQDYIEICPEPTSKKVPVWRKLIRRSDS